MGGSAGEDANVCISHIYIFLRNGDTKILLHLNAPFIPASQDKGVWVGDRMGTGGLKSVLRKCKTYLS